MCRIVSYSILCFKEITLAILCKTNLKDEHLKQRDESVGSECQESGDNDGTCGHASE